MSKELKALKQLQKSANLSNRCFRKIGPKSYKRGQGALLKVLHRHDGKMTSRELVETLGYDRKKLKDIVRKAQRNSYVSIEDAKAKKTYTVKLSKDGEEIAEKRCKAHTDAAAKILDTLSEDEIATLNSLTEKVILQCKELGAKGKHKKGKKRHCKKGHCCKRHC